MVSIKGEIAEYPDTLRSALERHKKARKRVTALELQIAEIEENTEDERPSLRYTQLSEIATEEDLVLQSRIDTLRGEVDHAEGKVEMDFRAAYTLKQPTDGHARAAVDSDEHVYQLRQQLREAKEQQIRLQLARKLKPDDSPAAQPQIKALQTQLYMAEEEEQDAEIEVELVRETFAKNKLLVQLAAAGIEI